jgi:hypothetical protein
MLMPIFVSILDNKQWATKSKSFYPTAHYVCESVFFTNALLLHRVFVLKYGNKSVAQEVYELPRYTCKFI